jgi:hypothetical protein
MPFSVSYVLAYPCHVFTFSPNACRSYKPFANILQEFNSLEILLTKEMTTQMCVGDGEIGIEMIFEWT